MLKNKNIFSCSNKNKFDLVFFRRQLFSRNFVIIAFDLFQNKLQLLFLNFIKLCRVLFKNKTF